MPARGIVYAYHDKELLQSKHEAYQSTLSYCYYLVTIPFAKSYYNSKLEENYRQQNFQEIFVDEQHFKNDEKEIPKKSYGLLDKSIINFHDDFYNKKNFKTILFNKKNQVRKFSISSESGFFGRYGTKFLGSKDQVQHLAEKIRGGKKI